MNFDKIITKKLSVDSMTSLFSRIWYKLEDSVSQRKRRRQCAAKGYCDRDLFMLSSWFFGIIPEMLEEIKKKRLGVSTHYIMENRESFGIKSYD